MQRFCLETQKGTENLEDLSVDDQIMLTFMVKTEKCGLGFIQLRIGTTGVLL
jgi:hypothetical protein